MTVAADAPKPLHPQRVAAAIDPAVLQGIRQASASSHIDFGYLMAQAAQESGFHADAKAATSSAAGLFQFIESTWLAMVKQHGAQHGIGQLAQQIATDGAGRLSVADPAARAHILALREDPVLSAGLAAEYTKSNKDEVERALGRPAGSAELYLAHFLGAGGATQLLKAVQEDSRQSAAALLPDAAGANHAVFFDAGSGAPRSVGELYRSFATQIERNVACYAGMEKAGCAPAGLAAPPSSAAGTSLVKSPAAPIGALFNALLVTALGLIGAAPHGAGQSAVAHRRSETTAGI
jgi:Transglycosylase SLT domain